MTNDFLFQLYSIIPRCPQWNISRNHTISFHFSRSFATFLASPHVVRSRSQFGFSSSPPCCFWPPWFLFPRLEDIFHLWWILMLYFKQPWSITDRCSFLVNYTYILGKRIKSIRALPLTRVEPIVIRLLPCSDALPPSYRRPLGASRPLNWVHVNKSLTRPIIFFSFFLYRAHMPLSLIEDTSHHLSAYYFITEDIVYTQIRYTESWK